MDAGLVYRFEEVAGSGRNRLLVLLEGLCSLPVEQLRHLTLATAASLLKELPVGTPHRNRILAMFREYAKRMQERDPSLGKDSLLFPAHGERTKGFAPSDQPLSRVQVWRVVKAAVQAVLGGSVRGAVTALRAVLGGLSPAQPLLDDLDDLVHDGPHPDFDPDTGRRRAIPSTA